MSDTPSESTPTETLPELLAETRPLRFGDPVVCIFASEDNPLRNALFVRWKTRVNGDAEVTDGDGRFWINGSVFHADDAALFPALHEAIWKKQFTA